MSEKQVMISTSEAQEFVPVGRKHVASHPGKVPLQLRGGSIPADSGLPLVKALRDFTIKEKQQEDSWKLRRVPGGWAQDGEQEELYVNGNTVVWSRGTCDGAGHVVKSYTLDTPVQEALWCSFLLPKDLDKDKTAVPVESDVIPCEVQTGICVVEPTSISILNATGTDYITALPFLVSKTWPIQNGLLFERQVTATQDGLATPKRDQPGLPVLFSMLHPLDEVPPVICRTGGNTSNAKLSYVTEVSQQIIFSSEEPSLVMTYDRLLSIHAVWAVRRAKPEEGYAVLGTSSTTDINMSQYQRSQPVTPGFSQSGNSRSLSQHSTSLSRLTFSSQSPSFSPFRSYGSKVNSPVPAPMGSKFNSPSISYSHSHTGLLSRSQSPSVAAGSLYRLHTPSPQARSPANFARTPISANMSMAEQSFMETQEPLVPEICLDHLWTENATVPRDGAAGKAYKAFLSSDLCGQNYLCYLVSHRNHLRLVKFEESNDKSQLIFGSLTILQAKDAVPLKNLNMILVLDTRGQLVIHSGTTKVHQIHVPGIPGQLAFSQSGGISGSLGGANRSSFGGPIRIRSGIFGSPPKLTFSGGQLGCSGNTANGDFFGSSGGHMSGGHLSGGHMSGPVTSSRPPSALDIRFDEEVGEISPVRSEFTESFHGESSMDDLRIRPIQPPTTGPISAIKDAVDNHFTVELIEGGLFRTSLPAITYSPVVSQCLKAIQQILPKDIAMQFMVQWYVAHNAPGSVNGQSEWMHFVKCLLGATGFDSSKTFQTQEAKEDGGSSMSPEVARKKARPGDQEEDWQYLLASEHHAATAGPDLGWTADSDTPSQPAVAGLQLVDAASLLFKHMPTVFFALHLVYEDLKLNSFHTEELESVATLLHFLARNLGLSLYVDMYTRDSPALSDFCLDIQLTQDQRASLTAPHFLTAEPPHIFQWLCNLLHGEDCLPFPHLPLVTDRTKQAITLFGVLMKNNRPLTEEVTAKFTRRKSAVGVRVSIEDCLPRLSLKGDASKSPFENAVLLLSELEPSLKHQSLTFGVAVPLQEAVYHCRHNPPSDWPEEAYKLIDRLDLARQQSKRPPERALLVREAIASKGAVREEEDGMEYLDKELLKLRFSDDLRVQEVRRLLQSARPVKIAVTQRPEVSDHEFIEEQERHLYATCIRTMALPMGRGMFTLSTYHPVPTEALPIPKLCLTGRAPPRNTTVDLTHIDVPTNIGAWPQFHNGVAAALRIANSSELDSTWIMYNKPKSNELTNEHAGFLMGLGLNKHLSELAMPNIHDYLCKGHEFTSVGLLLGIAAEKRGTMDVSTTKLLSIHVSLLLPPTSTELDIPHNIQVAAVLGVGLVYQGTAHRHIAEVLLSEIGRPPGPEMENCTDRESYSLAAGLALGLVLLGKGSEMASMSDMNLADQLFHYMAGGHKRALTGIYRERYKSPSYQIKEGDYVNVDVTAPGATLALGMMFFNTENSAVAEWLTPPDAQYLLDFVRPDFLMLRVIARGLVMWEQIHPSEEWVYSNIPEIVLKYGFNKWKYKDDPECDVDFETMSQAYSNIMAGACMVIGLKFAGTANEAAFHCLMKFAKKTLDLMGKVLIVEQAGKSTVETCLVTIILSLAMVMAGTGNLEVLRMCRYLRARVGVSYPYVLYGSHMAISMAIGLLFLGGGRYTLSNKPDAVAVMLCAFFPKFPIHSNDNRYHLQAFRHLYVLAAEPRVIVPKDVVTGHLCYVPLDVKFKDTDHYQDKSYKCFAPSVLPDLDCIHQVKVCGPRYWPISFQEGKNWNTLKKLLDDCGYLYVKQRVGHLSYKDDPNGYRSVLSQSLTSDKSHGKVIKPEDIKSLSSDPRILAFADYFCRIYNEKDYTDLELLSQVLQECVSQEKLDALPVYVTLHQIMKGIDSKLSTLHVWQLKLLSVFYEWLSSQQSEQKIQLISPLFLCAIQGQVTASLSAYITENSDVLRQYIQGAGVEKCHPQFASYLVWNDIPHSSQFSQLQITGSSSFPEIYKKLSSLGLMLPVIRTFAKMLNPT